MSAVHRLLLPLALLALQATRCHGACVELESDTEAVVNHGFKLGCISCKMRGEVAASATVHWYFKESRYDTNYSYIYVYENEKGEIIDPRFYDRLSWYGSNHTNDLQDGSIHINNVSLSDAGEYMCIFDRILKYTSYNHQTKTNRIIHLKVVEQVNRGLASVLSEVMMYVSIIGLQLWLVVEMIYCYRKIAAAGEEALRESAAEYLAIASESKDNCAGEQAAE